MGTFSREDFKRDQESSTAMVGHSRCEVARRSRRARSRAASTKNLATLLVHLPRPDLRALPARSKARRDAVRPPQIGRLRSADHVPGVRARRRVSKNAPPVPPPRPTTSATNSASSGVSTAVSLSSWLYSQRVRECARNLQRQVLMNAGPSQLPLRFNDFINRKCKNGLDVRRERPLLFRKKTSSYEPCLNTHDNIVSVF
jgi:hypothetical protein